MIGRHIDPISFFVNSKSLQNKLQSTSLFLPPMFQMHEIESALKETFVWMKEHALGTKDIFCLKS